MKRNVLITGASRGIGKEIARGLCESCNLFLISKNADLLCESAKEFNAEDFFACDLSNKENFNELSKFVEKNSIDILVNNAGAYVYGEIDKMSYEQIFEIFHVNLVASTYLCSCVAKNMKTKNWGRIINIGSISGVMGESFASLYSASKAGLIGLSKALALEFSQFNITVNTINPGWVETELGLKSIDESEFTLQETLETIPQKRFVKPAEIEKLIEYLISDNAKGVTGQSINLCAGLSLGC